MKITGKFRKIKNEKCEKPNKTKNRAESFFKTLDTGGEMCFNLHRDINLKVTHD